MTDQIASITLRADVSDLKTASNELDRLGEAAAGAVDKADDLNSVFRAGAESAKQGSEGLKEQQNALKGLLENIDPVTKALNRLDEQQESLRKFQAKGFLDTETFQAYNKILDDTRLKLTDTGEAAARAQAELAATQAAEKQSAALKNLLGSIDPTIRAFNSLDEQHAQLVAHFEAGRINGAQFEHFNTILNQTRERLSGVADVLPEALSRQEAAARRAGISVGQYSAALRTLPAQFTDIATQLAGGQSPFLILLQQGGQIKDSFGGLGPMLQALRDALFGFNEESRETAESAGGISEAAEGLNNTSEAAEKLGRAGGLLNGFNLAIAGTVGLLAILAGAAYSSSQQFDNVARSLILMGGAGFSSMQQLNDAAQDVADNAGASLADSVDTLVQLNDTGKYTADQMTKIAKSIMAMGDAGLDTKAALADFSRLVSDPVKALASLNQQYGFVDEAMMKHIITLEKTKGKTAAANEAITLFADTMEDRSNKIVEATDNIGQAWNWIKAFSSDIFGQIGVTVRAWGNQVIEVFKLLSTSFEALFVKMKEVSLEIMGGMITGFTDIANKLPGGETLIKSMGFDGLAESVAKNREAASKEYTQLTAEYNKHIANLSKSQWQWEEEAKNGLGGGVKGTGSVDRQTKDAVSKLAEDSAKKTKEAKATLEAGDRTLENYRAQARTLTETLEILRQTGETHAKNTEFSKQQSRFAELDEAAKTRALTAQEKSLLSSREAILNAAKVVDQKNKEVEAQQKINGLAQQANKYVTQMSEKTDALRDSAGLSSRQTQRMMEEAQLRQGWLNGGGKLDDAGYKKELAALRKYYAEEDKLRGDWKAGAVSGWNEYLDAATNTYDAVKNVASSTLTGLGNMLTELMTTGTASVKEFGKSMLKMILEITNQLIVAYTVQAAMGWISGGSKGGSTPGGSYANAAAGLTFNAKGGVYDSPGLSKYVNGVYDSPQYFTFQGASKFAKGGVFAEAGAEAIMPLTRDSAGRLGVRAQGSGGMAPVINTTVNVDAGGSATVQSSSSGDAMGRALADEMQNAALQVIQKHLKPGGMIYNFSKGR
ncbi:MULTISPECIES: phage tail tape measure protein [Enterobacter cloacae complex]|uniref:phage tail tape measure protein n=1 Tax=Enterobacter cloacae complex TaxID=354276 RepID=UPI000E2F25DA|nr:phage tail tape measure protein [Enterobacter hormaechei]MCW4684347.1 phage tail tape measure protein [Enterobacter hormaechei subsp. xiangfangensis]MCW4785877.1 phage tail tape measure protein [Enterobacter hormaechei subsp. xiangfangensis]MCW4814155.1 phage tail tape measure protein [Enterobacter hormaechei subsp. xiangfangensis]MCW4935528.1 phage tail tape measure protein [Enterobacter hormaechei subsp. xiangfangensis]MCW5032845.1 phage tail tape measure protein [Enterobacter hormaechei 